MDESKKEKAVAGTTAIRICCLCGEIASLWLEDDLMICETCAQYQNDLAP